MKNFSKGKQLIGEVEFITCPYCNELDKKKKEILDPKHLKKHNKTLDDVRKEFPDHITMTFNQHNKRVQRGLSQKKSKKKVKCYYHLDNDCPGEVYEVNGTAPNYVICDHCKKAGKENPDGRTKKEANEKREKVLQEKYGVRNARLIDGIEEKISETCNIKYGGVGFASDELAEKTRAKNKELYGNENIMKTNVGQKRFKESMIEKYNTTNPLKIPEVAEKVSKKLKGKESQLKGKLYEEIHGIEKSNKLKEQKKQIFINRFLENEFPKLLDHFKFEFIDEKYLGAHVFHHFKCKICGTLMLRQWNSIQQDFKCEVCYPRNNGTSIAEKEILNFVIEVLGDDVEVIENTRKIIPPKELDIYIPSKNIAIEHNGLYYHSEQYKYFSGPTYHMDKTNNCIEKGIRLIHIFEDEWILKKDICKARLKQILGMSTAKKINARDCIIKEISSKIKNKFLDNFHIQGSDNSTIKLGAFYNDELVSVMTFSKGNISKGSRVIPGIWELNRFCSDYNYHIPGVAGKLLAYFKRNYEWIEVFSYADRRWSDGNLYTKLGFHQLVGTRLNYWYVKNGKRFHRFGLRKRPNEPKDITEKTLRILEGYTIVWDCGSLKYSIKNN